MATYTKTYTLTITSGSPTGETVYTAVDKLEDNIDQIITDLNNCHMTANGDMIYRAAGVSTKLAIGAAGKLVLSDGTGPTWDLPPSEQRAIFAYASDSVITITPGQYWCYDKFCKWAAALTSTQIATGSPTATDWYYLYLDYSEITSNTAIVAAKLIWSTTEPAWSSAYRGWYNGYDRCIFACRGNAAGTDIDKFYHDGGDYVVWDAEFADRAAADVGTDWADEVTLTIPLFSTRAQAHFRYVFVNAGSIASWRTDGSSGSGHTVGQVVDADDYSECTCTVITGAASKIDVKDADAATNTLAVSTQGWYFPAGM